MYVKRSAQPQNGGGCKFVPMFINDLPQATKENCEKIHVIYCSFNCCLFRHIYNLNKGKFNSPLTVHYSNVDTDVIL